MGLGCLYAALRAACHGWLTLADRATYRWRFLVLRLIAATRVLVGSAAGYTAGLRLPNRYSSLLPGAFGYRFVGYRHQLLDRSW